MKNALQDHKQKHDKNFSLAFYQIALLFSTTVPLINALAKHPNGTHQALFTSLVAILPLAMLLLSIKNMSSSPKIKHLTAYPFTIPVFFITLLTMGSLTNIFISSYPSMFDTLTNILLALHVSLYGLPIIFLVMKSLVNHNTNFLLPLANRFTRDKKILHLPPQKQTKRAISILLALNIACASFLHGIHFSIDSFVHSICRAIRTQEQFLHEFLRAYKI